MSGGKAGEIKTESVWGVDEEAATMEAQIASLDAAQLNNRTRILETNIKVMRSELNRLGHEVKAQQDKIKDNTEKIKMNKQLPYLVANVIEILDLQPEQEEDGSAMDTDAKSTKAVVIKTSTRQTVFLPVVGLVDAKTLKPGDLVGVNKDSYLILDTLPAEYDSRVKAMEVDEKPTEDYTDVGGLDKQIQELVEAVVRPMTHADLFKSIGIRPPKGVLLYGPPGTGKTLLARACAAKTNACFLKLAAPQLVQMFIGDGAKLVRDAFALAHEKAPAIIFIDELDAIGTKRFDSDKCFAAGTQVRLFNGDTIAVEHISGGERLMGDDGTVRVVTPGSLARGTATMYRITPKWTGATPFVVSGNHVLVLVVNNKPCISQQTTGNWRVEWWEMETDGVPRRRSLTLSSKQAVQQRCDELTSDWEPLVFETTVSNFLTLPVNLKTNAAKLCASGAVTFQSPLPRLQQVLALILGAGPTALQLDWAAWFLGMWLTDGSKRGAFVYQGGAPPPDPRHHHEIFARLHQYTTLFHVQVTQVVQKVSTACHPVYHFGFGGVNGVAHRLLAAYGLIGNKHVPQAWLCDSIDVRRRLLAGIIDGDGHYHVDHNQYTIPGKQQAVVQGFKLLAASLGIRNSQLSPTRCVSEKGKVYLGHRVFLYGHMWDIVQYCAATYKRCPAPGTLACVEKQSDSRCYGFSITPLPQGNYYGFAVQGGANRRFLLADFTVTHNSGDREVQRTMLELLNQLDGFSSDDRIKVIAATNRPDILDPALLRSGRLDRKIEFPLPDEEGRANILRIHSNKMNVNADSVNFEELARCTDDFNGAMLKAVCVEAGMLALRRDATELNHEDFMAGIGEVQAKKKANLNYYA